MDNDAYLLILINAFCNVYKKQEALHNLIISLRIPAKTIRIPKDYRRIPKHSLQVCICLYF